MVKESRGRLQENISFNSVFNTDTRCSVDGRKRLVWTEIVLKTEQNSTVFI